MTYQEMQEKIEAMLEKYDSVCIYTSPDFQCDQTGGFPTSLCVCWGKGKAWLQLNDSLADEAWDLNAYEQMCADFGIRDCWGEEDLNRLLRELGEDAFQSAGRIPGEDRDYEMQI